jgi:sporulation protein YlmC with PRC-barrel domain
MDIPMNVKVLCETKECGQSSALVVNPVTEQITHIVVTENSYPYVKRLVPVGQIFESTPNSIRLRCSREELSQQDSFEEIDFINPKISEVDLNYDVPFVVWPYSLIEENPIEVTRENIPAGEIAIHRRADVHAKDGRVGKVDEFLVAPNSNHITHLVLREGHLWGKKDITIPVSEIDKIKDDGVYLRLDKEAIEKLPAIPVTRKWL